MTCGDVLFEENSVHYKPRLYLNDGKGNFSLQPNAIPDTVTTIAGCVAAADYDGDGDIDLFIGGRVSKRYPQPAKSFILQNNNGVFSDVTERLCPALEKPGMVTAMPLNWIVRVPPIIHKITMNVVAERTAVIIPVAKSTGDSVANRMSSATRYSGLPGPPLTRLR